MREKKSKVIGERMYEVTQLGAIQGRSVMVRLMKLAGSAVGSISGDSFLPALGQLCKDMTEEDLKWFCDQFAPFTNVDVGGKKPRLDAVFDEHFAGRYLEMAQWLAFCVEVNFGDFFEIVRAKLAAARRSDAAEGSSS